MKATSLLCVALFAVGCGQTSAQPGAQTPAQTPAQAAQKAGEAKTSTDPKVNPDAAIMADFKSRVDKYAELHKDLAKGSAKQKDNASADQVNKQADAIAAKIQAARAGAKQGDIFTAEMRPVFRRLLAPEMKGEDGRDAKAIIKDDAPVNVPFKVNAKYPDGATVPTVPANLLLNLPALPEPLQYRIIEKHLILVDADADVIVDYALNVIR